MFKIKTFAELKGNWDTLARAEACPTWWQRIMKWIIPDVFEAAFNVRRENTELRGRLLGAIKAGEDAGRNGLILYAENEKLNQLVQLTNATPEQVSLMSKSVLEQSKEIGILQDKLKRLQDSYNQLDQHTHALIAKFGGDNHD
jgi:hypothetical protein